MENETRDGQKQRYTLRRAVLDYGMGVIIFAIGIVILLAPKFGLSLILDSTQRYFLGGLFLLYGAFRAYRGKRKDYYN